MFVWAMRDKGSEWRAVRSFLASGEVPFTPLVEAVCEPFIGQWQKPAQDPAAIMAKLSGRLAPLTDYGHAWVDLGHLTRLFSPRDVAEMYRLLRRSNEFASHLVVPVVRVSSPDAIIDAAISWSREQHSGICIRVDGLTRLPEKGERVRSIVALSGLSDSEIDFVVDAQDLPRTHTHEEIRAAFPLCEVARTWTVLAGTFPPSLTDLNPDKYEHARERDEWLAWRDEIEQETDARCPLYGDFATQPAIYEPAPGFPGSPSVRYSTGKLFVILRGRRGSMSAGIDYSQFIGHARYLRQQPYFCDVIRTSGDDYVDRIAVGTNGTGNHSTWRVASLTRHLQVVAQQISTYAPVLFART